MYENNIRQRIIDLFVNYEEMRNIDEVTFEVLTNKGFRNFDEYELLEHLYNTITISLESIMAPNLEDRDGRIERARRAIYSRIARTPDRFGFRN